MAPADDSKTVLVVDDDEDVADMYAIRLRERYDVRIAYGGEAALETIDEDVDVVLLDRRMPDLSGDEVLEEIRERDLGVRVIMVTAVDPDFDIVDMAFDDYLCKPVDVNDMVEAIDQQLRVGDYESGLSEYFRVTSKLAVLETEKTVTDLERSEEYTRLQQRRDELEAELDEALADFEDVSQAFGAIDRTGRR